MGNRKVSFAEGEYYHCYNRGVDKRVVFKNMQDFEYFLFIIDIFNQEESFGEARLYKTKQNQARKAIGDSKPLVTIHAYCLNPNHFHLILSQCQEGGISKFMQKIGTGYTMYFNQKYGRSGALFQGAFKASHIHSDEYLRRTLAYVTLNNMVHGITDTSKYRNSYHALFTQKNDFSVLDKKLAHEIYGTKDLKKKIQEHLADAITHRKALKQSEKSELLE